MSNHSTVDHLSLAGVGDDAGCGRGPGYFGSGPCRTTGCGEPAAGELRMCSSCLAHYHRAHASRRHLARMLLEQRPELFTDLASSRLAGVLAEHLVAHACAGAHGFGAGEAPIGGEVAARLDFIAERDELTRAVRRATAVARRRGHRRHYGDGPNGGACSHGGAW